MFFAHLLELQNCKVLRLSQAFSILTQKAYQRLNGLSFGTINKLERLAVLDEPSASSSTFFFTITSFPSPFFFTIVSFVLTSPNPLGFLLILY